MALCQKIYPLHQFRQNLLLAELKKAFYMIA
nr:MAG TPA_asm: hypothetical protein [Caudoviricetes sp.]